MSQIHTPSVGGTPSVATTFTADDLTSAIPVANILLVSSDSVEDNNANGINTTADPNGGNELFIELTNRFHANAITNGAITADIVTFDLGASARVYKFTFDVAARDTGTGDGGGYRVLAVAKTDGAGTASIIGVVDVNGDEDATLLAMSITVVVSGNTIILRVTGVALQTINYTTVGTYVRA